MALGLVSSLARLKFDTRVQDWHLSHGKMSPDELKAHLQGLEDCASKIDLDTDDSDDGDFGDDEDFEDSRH
jgi:hypothetical protein